MSHLHVPAYEEQEHLMPTEVRRVITGISNAGKSTVIADGPNHSGSSAGAA